MKFAALKKPICLLLTGMLSAGSPLMAGGPVEMRSSDVVLNDGVLTGTVLNASAQPVSGVNVQLIHGETVIARATSDEEGQFAVRGLRNGGHVLQVGTVQQPVRFWGTQSAPPTAAAKMAIVVDENVVRGQQDLNDYLIPGIIIGGALAITLATTLGANDPYTPPSSP